MGLHILRGLLVVVLVAGILYAALRSRLSDDSAHFHIYVTNEEAGTVTIIDGVTETVVTTIPVGKRPRGIKLSPDNKTVYVALSGKPVGGPGVKEGDLPPSDPKEDAIGVIDVSQKKLVRRIQARKEAKQGDSDKDKDKDDDPVISDPEQFDITKDGSRLIISNEDDASVSILDIKSEKVLATIAVTKEPEGVTLDSANKFAYVTCEEQGEIHAIDIQTLKHAGMVKVGARPRTIAIMPDGMHAYVPSETEGEIHKIKLQPLAPDKVIKTPGLTPEQKIRPMGTTLSADGKRLFVTTGHGGAVLVIDTTTDAIVKYIDVGKRPWGIALSPDGKKLYTANGLSNDITIVNTDTYEVIKRIKVDAKPWGIAVGK